MNSTPSQGPIDQITTNSNPSQSPIDQEKQNMKIHQQSIKYRLQPLYYSFRARRKILPTLVLGSSSRNSTNFGTL